MTAIFNSETHVGTADAAKLLNRPEATLRGWRHRQKNLVVLPFSRDANGKCMYALSDIQAFVSEQTGEQLDPEIAAAVFSDVPNLGDELAKIRSRRHLRDASKILRKVVELLGRDEIELHMGAAIAARMNDIGGAEFIAGNIAGCRDLLLSASVWLADWSDAPEPSLNDQAEA